jgi:hypothetical protein
METALGSAFAPLKTASEKGAELQFAASADIDRANRFVVPGNPCTRETCGHKSAGHQRKRDGEHKKALETPAAETHIHAPRPVQKRKHLGGFIATHYIIAAGACQRRFLNAWLSFSNIKRRILNKFIACIILYHMLYRCQTLNMLPHIPFAKEQSRIQFILSIAPVAMSVEIVRSEADVWTL